LPASTVREVGSSIIKTYADEWRWKLVKELYVYGLLDAHDVDVPVARVLRYDDVTLSLEKLPGSRPDPDEFLALAPKIGALLREFHRVTFSAFGYLGTHGIVDAHATNAAYMRFQFDKKLREFEELGGDASLGGAIAAHVGEREHLLAGCECAVLCHNDCHAGNVLVDGGRITGLLDVENALAGDPLLDLAKAHCYAPGSSEVTLAALVEGYGPVRDDWRDAVDLYVVYHLLELWDWFAFLGAAEPLAGIAASLTSAASL
jgi:aminoglycoside phosphotransferase (APT) family kinase protein